MIDPKKINVLWISDVPGWAYSSVFDGLTKVTETKFTQLNLVQAFHDEVVQGRVDPNDYDVVVLWAWFNVITERSMGLTTCFRRCPPDRTILCVASEWAAKMMYSMERVLRPYRYFAGASERVTEILQASLPWATVHNLEHGTDLEKFKPTPYPYEFTVGWAGNQNAPNKRFAMAQSICKEAKLPLKVAGHKGSDRYVDDMPRWYDDISVLLITSITEVHPLVYYEAAAAGRPAVSTLVGDIGYGRAKAGVFFPIEAPESEFVDALKRLKKSSMELNRLGVLARLQAVKYWGWEQIAPSYVKYILEVNNHAV